MNSRASRSNTTYLVCLTFYHDDPTRTLVVIVNRTLTSRRPTHQDHIHVLVVKDKVPGVSFGILLVPVYVFLVLRGTRIPLRYSSGYVTNIVIRVRGSDDVLLQEIEKRSERVTRGHQCSCQRDTFRCTRGIASRSNSEHFFLRDDLRTSLEFIEIKSAQKCEYKTHFTT